MLTGSVSLQDENLQSAPGSRVGTPAYLAPEVILTTQGNKYNAKVSTAPGNEHVSSSTAPQSLPQIAQAGLQGSMPAVLNLDLVNDQLSMLWRLL